VPRVRTGRSRIIVWAFPENEGPRPTNGAAYNSTNTRNATRVSHRAAPLPHLHHAFRPYLTRARATGGARHTLGRRRCFTALAPTRAHSHLSSDDTAAHCDIASHGRATLRIALPRGAPPPPRATPTTSPLCKSSTRGHLPPSTQALALLAGCLSSTPSLASASPPYTRDASPTGRGRA